jgi:hypothetical protein
MAEANAGWFRDPTGRAEQRYWNGQAWTEHVARGTEQATDPMSGDYAPPLAAGPAMQPAPRRKPKWPWVLGGILAALVVLGGGCAVIVGVAINNAVETLNAEQRAHAISKDQFDGVPLGASHAAVIQMLGKQPENTQEFVNKGVLTTSELTSSCTYYNRKGETFGTHRFQFCFDGDSLQSKNAY